MIEGVNTFVSTQAFNGEFYVYTANGPSGNKGYLSLVSGATAEKCPAGRSLHATGKKLTPGIHPMGFLLGKPFSNPRILVSVYDSISLLRGFIDPMSSTFTRPGMPIMPDTVTPVVEPVVSPSVVESTVTKVDVDALLAEALPLAVGEAVANLVPAAVNAAVAAAVTAAVTDSVAQTIPSAIAAVSQSVPSVVANAVAAALANAIPAALAEAIPAALANAIPAALAEAIPAAVAAVPAPMAQSTTVQDQTKLVVSSRALFPAGDYTINAAEAGSSSIGSITNLPGKLAMKINTTALTENSMVFLTPIGRGPTLVAISDLQHSIGQFTIAAGSVCTVNWLIVN